MAGKIEQRKGSVQQSIATPAKSDTDQISHEQQTSGDMTAQPVAVDGSTLVYQAKRKQGYYYEVFNSCVQGVSGQHRTTGALKQEPYRL